MDGLPNFLTHNAPLAHFARRSSATIEKCTLVRRNAQENKQVSQQQFAECCSLVQFQKLKQKKFKIDDSKRPLLHRLKDLIEKNYELFYESATDEEESLARDSEEDLSIVFMIDDEVEEDWHWQCHWAWLKIYNFLCVQK